VFFFGEVDRSESSSGLFLLIGFITVKRSGMRGKSSVIRVCRYLLLPPIERKPRPSDALKEWRWGEKGSRTKCSCEIKELHTAIALSSQFKYHSVSLLILSVTFRL